MIHRFPHFISSEDLKEFNNPFRYVPHALVREAAGIVMDSLSSSIENKKFPKEVCQGFSEGKMLGVLVCKDSDGQLGYLAAFSGSVGGHSTIEGFVPPIFDLLEPKGYFKIREAEITALNRRIEDLTNSTKLLQLKSELSNAESNRDCELKLFRAQMLEARTNREKRREKCYDTTVLSELIRESQHEKAEFKRLKQSWERRIYEIRCTVDGLLSDIASLKAKRADMSDKLQNWIFRQYIVHNALGTSSSILDIFSTENLIPPGGTGDCAAPKLLEYAYRHQLKPLTMGEFWYGTSPSTAVRTHGHFYPSCTSKCGTLLGYMMQGLDISSEAECSEIPEIIYEDETIIAIDKPSGMPSVPGLDGKKSAEEWLNERSDFPIYAVHRLDMDTSGILLFAKTNDAAVNLRRQFEEHTVNKTYRSVLCPEKSVINSKSFASFAGSSSNLLPGMTGIIDLPLSPDYDERPRQKVDIAKGKQAITRYEVTNILPDGSTEILFHPVTGRTHQLRVHSAHQLGLGRPIKGDRLYGGAPDSSCLCLHACQIVFTHPRTKQPVTISTSH